MRRRPVLGTTSIALLVAFCLILTNSTLWAYSGGTGEPNDPYQIATAADLIELGNDPNNYDKHFILTADIDLDPNLPGGQVFDRAVIGTSVPFTRGRSTSSEKNLAFRGFIDGQGHVISNLTMNCSDQLGALVGGMKAGAELRNIGLEDVDIRSGHLECDYLAALVAYNQGTVTGCYSTGRIVTSDTSIAGGLIAGNGGDVFYCYSLCQVYGGKYRGGLIGYNSNYRYNEMILWQCYSARETESPESHIALIGYGNARIPRNCYYLDNNDVFVEDFSSGTALSHSEMCQSESYVGWNFANVNDVDCPWILPEEGYPKLNYQTGLVPVPDVSGMTVTDAQKRLSLSGYNVGEILYDYHVDVDKEGVIMSHPRFYIEDMAVDLIVSQGSYDWELNSGDGSSDNPYLIQTAGQLNSLSDHAELYDKAFILCNDINLNGRFYTGPLIDSPFTGQFDGQGHVVFNLVMFSEEDNGLFAEIGNAGVISRLALDEIYLFSNGSDGHWVTGGIASINNGRIQYCSVSGVLEISYPSDYFACNYGGLFVGLNQGELLGCATQGVILGTGVNLLGGLIGCNSKGIVRDCCAEVTMEVRDVRAAGGLIGGLHDYCGSSWNDKVIFQNCLAINQWDIVDEANDLLLGGLIGEDTYSYPVVRNCYYHSDGWDEYAFSNDLGLLLTSELLGECESFVGWDFLGVSVDGLDDLWLMSEDQYPRLAWQSKDYHWVPEITAMEYQFGVSMIVDAGFVIGETQYDYCEFIPVGRVIRTCPTGLMRVGSEVKVYLSKGPYQWEANPGQGTTESPYEIQSAGQLVSLSDHPELFDCHFKLVNDLDMQGYCFSEAVLGADSDPCSEGYSGEPFGGEFDGDWHCIRHLKIANASRGDDVKDYLGFLGRLAPEGRVIQLFLEDVMIYGGTESCCLGSLCASNQGLIQDCYASGFVTYTWYSNTIGGLVGENWGRVEQCIAESQLLFRETTIDNYIRIPQVNAIGVFFNGGTALSHQAPHWMGGLIGYNLGEVIHCYASGSVQGTEYSSDVGGLVGLNRTGNITACYSLGAVSGNEYDIGGLVGYNRSGDILVSFWDIETSGQIESIGGTGLSTDEMQDLKTYLDIGWDFVGETDNGTEDIWWMPEGDYPRLWWEE